MSLEINKKLQELKKAVESCGVIVSDVSLQTSIVDAKIIGTPIPYVKSITLDVTFKLELQDKNQARLS